VREDDGGKESITPSQMVRSRTTLYGPGDGLLPARVQCGRTHVVGQLARRNLVVLTWKEKLVLRLKRGDGEMGGRLEKSLHRSAPKKKTAGGGGGMWISMQKVH